VVLQDRIMTVLISSALVLLPILFSICELWTNAASEWVGLQLRVDLYPSFSQRGHLLARRDLSAMCCVVFATNANGGATWQSLGPSVRPPPGAGPLSPSPWPQGTTVRPTSELLGNRTSFQTPECMSSLRTGNPPAPTPTPNCIEKAIY
jgi:hypothetical protein